MVHPYPDQHRNHNAFQSPTLTPTFTRSSTPTSSPNATLTNSPTATPTPTGTLVTPTPTPGPGFYLSSNSVNSVSGPPLAINYQVVNGGSVEVSVFNVLGQRMRRVVQASQPPNYYSVLWDGSDDTGDALSTGLYLVVYSENGSIQIKKVLVMKK